MNPTRLIKPAILMLILLASWSCSSSSAVNDDGSSPAGPGGATKITLPEHPLISRIEAEPSIVSPGDGITLKGAEGLSGSLTFTSPNGETISSTIENGEGMISVPSDAAEGLYFGMFEMDSGAMALSTFRISTQPGVWLQADQRYVSPGETTALSIDTFEIPQDTVAAVYVQSEPEGAFTTLVPDERGRLVPGIPVPLSTIDGGAFTLDARYNGTIQVLIEPEGSTPIDLYDFSEASGSLDDQDPEFDGWESNTIQITTCEASGNISGDIAGEGFISAVWLDGSVRSNTAYTDDGSFSLAAGPGTVLLQAFRMIGDAVEELESQLVVVGCGETLTIANLGTAKHAMVAPEWISANFRLIRTWKSKDTPPMQPDTQSGHNEPCRTGLIWSRMSDSEGEIPNWSTLAAAALKTAISQVASQATISTLQDAKALAEKITEEWERGAAEEGWGEEEWIELVEPFVAMSAADFTIVQQGSKVGDDVLINVAALPVNPEDAMVRASGNGPPGAMFDPSFSAYTELAERFAQAAICGKVEPGQKQVALDEQVPITYNVTDLSGAGADGASVTISPAKCGKLDPESGTIEEQQFRTTFAFHTQEYCVEELSFDAQWSGPQGTISTKPDESTAKLYPDLPELTLFAGHAPGIGNTAALASAITLYEDYDVRNTPGGLPSFTQDPVCGFLEGGMDLTDATFFTRSESPGKRGEAWFEAYSMAQWDAPSEEYPADHIVVQMRLSTWGVPLEDANEIRGAWASGGNASNPILTETPGTILVFDLKNPGNLPTTPTIDWKISRNLEGASGHGVLILYKVIECGDDPGITDFGSLVLDAGILLESDDDFPSAAQDSVAFSEFNGDRLQIILWVNSLVTTATIRDDSEGAFVKGRGRLNLELDAHLTQVIAP